MATITGMRNFLATGDAFCFKRDPNNKNHTFLNRMIRTAKLTFNFFTILVVAPIAIVIKPISIFVRQFSIAIGDGNKYIQPENNNKNNTLFYIKNILDITKHLFIQIVLLPGYVSYSVVFAGLDTAVFILNDLLKEENGYFIEDIRKEQVDF